MAKSEASETYTPTPEESQKIFEEIVSKKPWTKWYDEEVPVEIEIPEIPLYSLLDRTASEYPDKEALVFFGKRVTYREYRESADNFAKAIHSKWGIGKGDVVALYLPNTPQFAISYYGVLKTGATVTPVNPLYTGEELARQLKKSKARILVALDLFANRVREALEEKGASVDAVVYTGIDDYLPAVLGFLYRLKEKKPKITYDGEKIVKFKQLLAIGSKTTEMPRPDISPKDDLAVLMFTGGTTGVPKGVMLTHYNLVANILQVDAWWKPNVKAKDTLVGILPWFHIYGQTAVLNLAVYRAARIIVFPRLDLDRLLRDVTKYKANIFHGVPTLYSLIINKPDIKKYDLSSIEVCISGAAPLPKAVAERFEELTGAKLREGYGLTETSPVTHVNPIYGKAKLGSIGVPVPNTLAAIADLEKPLLLPPGKVGELVVSGPQVMKGYYEMDEENRLVFFELYGRRWLRTGDIAYMDEEGYFYIVDRKKDTIKYKGITLFPREIEEVLYRHECVKEAAVVGIPDPHVGERPKAFIVLTDECKGKISADDIIEYAKKHLAEFKVPKIIEFRDELPKTAVGKILRRILREEELKKMKKGQ